MKKIILIVVCFLLIGCASNKELEEVTTDMFSTAASNNNLVVTNNISQYGDTSKYVDAYLAKLDDDIYLEMVVYKNEEDAEGVVNSHIKSFNMLKSTGASEVNETGKNYHKYSLISNGYYMTSNRVNNSVIFCKTKIDNKNVVEKILSDLGI